MLHGHVQADTKAVCDDMGGTIKFKFKQNLNCIGEIRA